MDTDIKLEGSPREYDAFVRNYLEQTGAGDLQRFFKTLIDELCAKRQAEPESREAYEIREAVRRHFGSEFEGVVEVPTQSTSIRMHQGDGGPVRVAVGESLVKRYIPRKSQK